MDRRTFLKRMSQTAAALSVARVASRTEAAMPARMSVAAVGDCIPARRISERLDDGFLEVVELLRSADCTWGNCETVIVDPQSVYPAAKQVDPHVICDVWGAEELAWMGLDCVGTANNHTMDWGNEGLFSTLERLQRAGISHAGAGRDLAQASRPGYTDCPAGRVAQVNCASTYDPYTAAGPAHPYVKGRPGLNPLGVDRAVQVDEDLFAQLQALQWPAIERHGWGDFRGLFEELLSQLPKGMAIVEETAFMAGDGFDLFSKAQEGDVSRICEAIGIARHTARVVLASIHAHEARNRLEVADLFLQPFARAAIDAGADAFFGTGPHVLRGIEIYQGKPIFYSLANFIFHYESVPQLPAEAFKTFGLAADTLDPSLYAAKIPYPKEARFWQSVVPRITFEGGTEEGGDGPRVVSIELFPITMGFGEPIYRRGTPELARGEEAETILANLAALSEPYGTAISVRDGIGRIELG